MPLASSSWGCSHGRALCRHVAGVDRRRRHPRQYPAAHALGGAVRLCGPYHRVLARRSGYAPGLCRHPASPVKHHQARWLVVFIVIEQHEPSGADRRGLCLCVVIVVVLLIHDGRHAVGLVALSDCGGGARLAAPPP
ncbi:hypothetical protein TW95_gp0029 [Pandoravirus inopinatum]|uniref:Uncharacterized protein n=1 Tax=Pandoravirus inopinatum TaxID=1605721 RepID=A0A0B5IVT2_9VIRU|nr:hypothetical protein TW95_gp0029 [Pandoravirus inopinatum]AJF96763.1 hypothetical protein [Pandoravirus inopinatum]